MAIISVTRLRLRSAWYLPKFLWFAIPSQRQARNAPGNLGAEVFNDAKLAFWTKSAWQDEASMRAFILAGTHRKAMAALQDMCDESATVHWGQESAELPAWLEGHTRLLENGRFTKMKHPSANQTAGKIPPPRGQ